jgi:predicted nuclease of predicted toxin-antitoxin system
MKFIVDAQLPFGLKEILNNYGFDSIHTDDLPDREKTTDNQIRQISVHQDRIVISKDSDFINSYYVHGIPPKLLVISTGNIKNSELYSLFDKNLRQIIELFKTCTLVEMDNYELIGHER